MTLLERVQKGELSAVARMISRVERGAPDVYEDLAELYRHGGRIRVVGIAGSPGTGKSTLVAGLAASIRARGQSVGILAIDPTSPIHGGAILGDRIRMNELSGDDGVFIRSMATRGCMGGLSHATADAVTVLDGAGFDVALVETVGVGQDEVEVAGLAETTVVVSVPGLGDDIQALKAGLLEIADIHVVNKADLPGAGATLADLKNTLRLVDPVPGTWIPPVLEVTAARGEGISALLASIDSHLGWLEESGELDHRLRTALAVRIEDLAHRRLAQRLGEETSRAVAAGVVDDVIARRRDPYSVAEELVRRARGGAERNPEDQNANRA